MRWPVAALLASLPWISTAVADPPPGFPYKATVTANDVYVRSGPGENYYPTDKLKTGDQVEVYRHDPGGWCAIRPPAGSFSWVSGRRLKLENKELATVVEDHVPARVGTRFSDMREVIQVRLNRGETVEVLDVVRTGPATATGANTLYKIAPPAGEFRWIHGKYLDVKFPRNGLRKNQAADAVTSQQGDGLPTPAETPLEASDALVADPGPPIPRRLSAEQYQKELSDIDVELSAMVVEEPTAWDFGELRQRTQSLLTQAETAVERGRARSVLSKIDRFEDIRQRSNAVAITQDRLARTDRRLARLGPRPRGTAIGTDTADRFDATGQLRRVPAAAAGAPQYALMDEKGNVRCYVSPAPGVNLRAYLGRQVGVTGTRGYMPEQRATHIMARHVTLMEAGGGGTMLR